VGPGAGLNVWRTQKNLLPLSGFECLTTQFEVTRLSRLPQTKRDGFDIWGFFYEKIMMHAEEKFLLPVTQYRRKYPLKFGTLALFLTESVRGRTTVVKIDSVTVILYGMG
jgi:hypothetical protein